MNDTIIYKLLKIIYTKGNIWLLLDDGYEYVQVLDLLDYLKQESYIEKNERGLISLTNKGNRFLNSRRNNTVGKSYLDWQLTTGDHWKKPANSNFVYVPRK